jgi:Ala-tRNA(Pro) deacylase
VPASEADLMARLAGLGIATTTLRHPPLFTVEESQRHRGDLPGGHAKNLFLKDKKGALWLVVAREDLTGC